MTPPASESDTAEDDAAQPPTPPVGPPVGERASPPQANSPMPPMPPHSLEGSDGAIANSVDVGQGMLNWSLDTVAKFPSNLRGCLTPARAVRQIAKRYTLLSQKVVVAVPAGLVLLLVVVAVANKVARLSIKFIAVIGLAGAGKSTIIRTLTGKDVHVGHSIAAGVLPPPAIS